jgi:hypothetical protein
MLESDRARAMLQGHHRAIEAVMVEAEEAVRSGDPARSARLVLFCWQLLRLLRSYQLFKHGEIFDPLGRHPDPIRARRAAAAKERCTAMGEQFGRHVQRWSAQGADSSPVEYKQQTTDVLAAVRRHLTHEAAEVELLLRDVKRTRRP